MITQLAQWYNALSIHAMSPEILQKRISEIKKIRTKNHYWILECIRIFLNKPLVNEDFISELTGIFTKSDPLFKQKDNNLELRILAGAIIYDYIINGKSKEKYLAALGMEGGLFGVRNDLINVDVIENVRDYVAQEALKTRDQLNTVDVLDYSLSTIIADNTKPALDQKFTEIKNAVNTIVEYFNKKVDILNRNVNILKEESNIHWWIFRNHSAGVKRDQLDKNILPIVVGKELSELVCITPAPFAAKEFINKILSDTNISEEQTTLEEVVNNVSIDFKKEMLVKQKNEIGNLCPIHLAYQKSTETGDLTSWQAAFEKRAGIDRNFSFNAYQLAYQFYIETLLLGGSV